MLRCCVSRRPANIRNAYGPPSHGVQRFHLCRTRSVGASAPQAARRDGPQHLRTWNREQGGSSMKPQQSNNKPLPALGATIALIGTMIPSPIFAHPYPNRPIQLAVAYPQGGTAEIVVRQRGENPAA